MAPKEYDHEITDIADYVANKPIDSELAVSFTIASTPTPTSTYPALSDNFRPPLSVFLC